jgi:hypothetical protein
MNVDQRVDPMEMDASDSPTETAHRHSRFYVLVTGLYYYTIQHVYGNTDSLDLSPERFIIWIVMSWSNKPHLGPRRRGKIPGLYITSFIPTDHQ